MKIRVVSTASKSLAVQVVRYRDNRTIVVKHIGSGKDETEVMALRQLAREWIERKTGQGKLFRWPNQAVGSEILAAVGRQTAEKLLKIANDTIVANDLAVDNDAELVWLPVF